MLMLKELMRPPQASLSKGNFNDIAFSCRDFADKSQRLLSSVGFCLGHGRDRITRLSPDQGNK